MHLIKTDGGNYVIIFDDRMVDLPCTSPLAKKVEILFQGVAKKDEEAERELKRLFVSLDFVLNQARALLPQISVMNLLSIAEAVVDRDTHSFILFLERLSKNRDHRVREGLVKFLNTTGIGISKQGMVVGWKAVRSDLKDLYSGKVLYRKGKWNWIPREHCDPDPSVACSRGLHIGSLHYALEYGKAWTWPVDAKILQVVVDPRDIVSIPNDDGFEKCRCHRLFVYEIFEIDEVSDQEALGETKYYDIVVPENGDEVDLTKPDEDRTYIPKELYIRPRRYKFSYELGQEEHPERGKKIPRSDYPKEVRLYFPNCKDVYYVDNKRELRIILDGRTIVYELHN